MFVKYLKILLLLFYVFKLVIVNQLESVVKSNVPVSAIKSRTIKRTLSTLYCDKYLAFITLYNVLASLLIIATLSVTNINDTEDVIIFSGYKSYF